MTVTQDKKCAVYSLGLVMPDASLSVLLARALADLTVNGEQEQKNKSVKSSGQSRETVLPVTDVP